MKFAQVLLYCAIVMAALAAGMGLASSYTGAQVALLGLGAVLVFRALFSKAPLRRWGLGQEEPPSRTGPVSALVAGLRDARGGSYIFQARVASMLRSIVEERPPSRALPRELLEPLESVHGLKGEDYMAALEAAVEVLQNG
jgi:hypothetical protein